MYIITNGKLITRDGENPYYEKGAVVTEGEVIVAVGEQSVLEKEYPQAKKIDAQGGVIMPSLVNAHTHIYSSLARGLAINGNNPTNFLEVLEGMWWNIDRKLTLSGTKASADALFVDCIKQGVTTVFDHHASFGHISGSLMEIAKSAEEFGVRACLCYEVSDRDGKDKALESIKENADFITHCQKNPSNMLSSMFGGHALFTISDPTFEAMVKANDGRVGYHIHVAEGMNDVYDSLQNYGRRPVQRLQDHGILGEKTILGHCIHVNSAEMDIIAQTKTMCVNNPESNMGNAVGCSPILQLIERGITVGLGTDGYTHDMLESLKVALAIQRHNVCHPNVGWGEVTKMLFSNNPLMAEKSFGVQLGVLKAGARADVIVMDYKPFTPFSGDNIDGHMLFGMTGRQCQTTMANGRLLMEHRKLLEIDELEVNAKILEQSKLLWSAING